MGDKRALLYCSQLTPNPAATPQATDSFILTEGQRQSDIELFKVEEKNA